MSVDFIAGMALVAACVAVFLAMPKDTAADRRLTVTRWFGKNYIWFFILVGGAGIVWAFATYIYQLPGLITDVLGGLKATVTGAEDAPDNDTAERIRNLAYAFGALAAALTIMATIPFQLIKVWLNERAARTAEQSHITDQINKAVEGLGAEKTVILPTLDPDGQPGHDKNGNMATIQQTVPNIEVRVGAIYALERIAQDSLRDHVSIMEILTAYIRQNSPASTAKPFIDLDTGEEMPDWEPLSDDADFETRAKRRKAREQRFGAFFGFSKAWRWADTLTARTDIQAAMQVLGRRSKDQCATETGDKRYGPDGYRMDLRNSNLQAVDISHGNFKNAQLQNTRLEGAKLREARMDGADLSQARMEGADLSQARMKGANLSQARMKGANLFRARMEGADLSRARMEGANLFRARMEGADLFRAQIEGTDLSGARMAGANLFKARMEGANLFRAQFDQSTDLRAETNRGSALRSVDFTGIDVSEEFLKNAFGDGSVTLPNGYIAGEGVLAHWHPHVLNREDFIKARRAWQVEIGYRTPD